MKKLNEKADKLVERFAFSLGTPLFSLSQSETY